MENMILKGNAWVLEGGIGGVCVHMCTCFHGCLRDIERVHCLQLMMRGRFFRNLKFKVPQESHIGYSSLSSYFVSSNVLPSPRSSQHAPSERTWPKTRCRDVLLSKMGTNACQFLLLTCGLNVTSHLRFLLPWRIPVTISQINPLFLNLLLVSYVATATRTGN